MCFWRRYYYYKEACVESKTAKSIAKTIPSILWAGIFDTFCTIDKGIKATNSSYSRYIRIYLELDFFYAFN